MKDSRFAFTAAIFWFILVTILLTLPGSAFPRENWMNRFWIDKWVHLALFAVLVVLWAGALGRRYPGAGYEVKRLILLGMGGLVYGIGMEFVQREWVANRSFDGGDILADAAGCALAVIYGWNRYKKNKPL